MRLSILFIFLSVSVFGQSTFHALLSSGGKNYYVATAGSGSGVGTQADPFTGNQFETLLETDAIPDGSVIHFKRGDTFHNQFDVTTNSGLTFIDYSTGALPIIDGGATQSSWTLDAGTIYYSSLATQPKWVFVSDKAQKMAETAWIPIVSRPLTTTLTALATTLDALDGVEALEGAFLVAKEWSFRPTVLRVVTNYVTGSPNGTITVNAKPENDAGGAAAGMPFKLLNKKSFIDETGEWSYDDAADRLYIKTASGSPTGVTIATLDYGIKLGSNVSNIVITNIRFKHQFLEGVYSVNNHNVLVQNCQFYDIRTNAASFTGNGTNIRFIGNDINRIGNNAVHIGGIDGGYFRGNTIDSIGIRILSIPHYSYFKSVGCGFHLRWDSTATVFVPKRVQVIYNDITNSGYCGIVNVGIENVIEYNHIDTFLLNWADGGAIYSSNVYFQIYGGNSDTRDCSISHNLIKNGLGGSLTLEGITGGVKSIMGIYMDKEGSETTVDSNYVEKVNDYGIFCNRGNQANSITNNKIVEARVSGITFAKNEAISILYPNADQHVLTGNTVVSRDENDWALYLDSQDDDTYDPFANGGSCNNNRYVNTYDVNVVNTDFAGAAVERTLASWQALLSHDAASTSLTNNLKFVDAAKADIDVLTQINTTLSPTTLSTSSDNYYLDETGANVTSASVPARSGRVLVRDWQPDGTLIVEDTFTGSAGNLTGHTPDTGPAWTISTGTFALDGAGYVTSSVSGSILQDISVTGVTIEATGQGSAQGNVVTIARAISNTDRIIGGLFLNTTPSSSNARIFVNSTSISTTNKTSNVNTDYTIKFKIRGGTAGVWIDGSLFVDIVNNSTVSAENPSTTTHGMFISTLNKFTRIRIWNQ